MKTLILVLSLALSATALFAQETQVTSGSYSSISTYPSSNSIPDKLVELCWETHFSGSPTLTGPEKVKLKKGENLVVTIQAPAQVSSHFSSDFVDYPCLLNSIIYRTSYSEEPCKSDDHVLMQDNNIENRLKGIPFRANIVGFCTSDIKPIVLNYQAGQSSGTRVIYFHGTVLIPTDEASCDDMKIYVTVE